MRLSSAMRVAGWICTAAIVILSLLPGEERPVTGVPGQVDHVLAYAGTAALLTFGYPSRFRIWIALGLITLAGSLELAQLWVPGRHCRLIDLAAGALGTVTGILVATGLMTSIRLYARFGTG